MPYLFRSFLGHLFNLTWFISLSIILGLFYLDLKWFNLSKSKSLCFNWENPSQNWPKIAFPLSTPSEHLILAFPFLGQLISLLQPCFWLKPSPRPGPNPTRARLGLRPNSRPPANPAYGRAIARLSEHLFPSGKDVPTNDPYRTAVNAGLRQTACSPVMLQQASNEWGAATNDL